MVGVSKFGNQIGAKSLNIVVGTLVQSMSTTRVEKPLKL